MTHYILDRKKLNEILLGHKTFISQRCRDLSAQGVDLTKLTYRETDKFTEEYIDTVIKSFPVEKMMDDIDKLLSDVGLKSSKEYLKEEDERNSKIKS